MISNGTVRGGEDDEEPDVILCHKHEGGWKQHQGIFSFSNKENVPFADEYDEMIDRFAPPKPLHCFLESR